MQFFKFFFYSDIIDKLGIDLADLGLDIDQSILDILEAITFQDYVFDPLNTLFNGDNSSYVEDVFVKTTVNELLYSVSTFR